MHGKNISSDWGWKRVFETLAHMKMNCRLHPCSSPTMNMKFMLKRKKTCNFCLYLLECYGRDRAEEQSMTALHQIVISYNFLSASMLVTLHSEEIILKRAVWNLTQLSNLRWMPNSVRIGFGTAMKTGSSKWFKRLPQNLHVSFKSASLYCGLG